MLKKYLLWILLVGIHISFFAYRISQGQVMLNDSAEYIHVADNIESYGVLYSDVYEPKAEIDVRPFTKRPPIYPIFLVAFSSGWFALVIQMLLSLFNIWLVVRILDRMGYGMNKWLAMLLFILTPAQFIYTNFIMSEILLQTFLLLFVYQMLRFIGNYSIKPLLWGTLIIVLAMLTKPVMYPFAYVYLLAICIYAVWQKRFTWIIAGILPMLVVYGYQQINKQRTGYAHFSSISNINLLQYNIKYMLQSHYGTQYADSLITSVQEAAEEKESFKEQQEYIKSRSFDILEDHKRAYTISHLKGMVTFILDPGRFDLYNYFSIEEKNNLGFLHYINDQGLKGVISYLKTQPKTLIFILLFVAFINLIKSILVMLFLFSKKVNTEVKLVVLGMIFYLAFLTGPIGASRFMLPVLPLIVMAIVMVWEEVAEMASKINQRLKFL